MWPDRRLLDRFEIDIPIVQAPMAGAMDTELAIAVALAGALASLPGHETRFKVTLPAVPASHAPSRSEVVSTA